MKNVTLKQFRYFEALAQHGHFGRAAEACAITQPALSMQIKALEEELGAALFERNSRDIRLTSFGAEVALRTRSILQALEDLEGYARASRGGSAWRLRIGVIPTIAPYLLPSLVADLTRLHDGLDLHVRETLTPKLVQELNEGRLDMAIVALPVSEPTLTEMALFTEDFVFVRPRKDEGKPVPSREALREMRLLLLEEGHCFREQALAFCNKDVHAAKPRDLLDASSLSTLVHGRGRSRSHPDAGDSHRVGDALGRCLDRPVRKAATNPNHRHGLAQDKSVGGTIYGNCRGRR